MAELRHPQDENTLLLDGGEPVTRRARTVLVANAGPLRREPAVVPGTVPDDGLTDVDVIRPGGSVIDPGRRPRGAAPPPGRRAGGDLPRPLGVITSRAPHAVE